ncbi:MAG: hypothetical protein OIF38_12110, partial [Cellvibrionaceae bacterium]|nr:hypothetical protein [Cellvibrionaceae bacterium]
MKYFVVFIAALLLSACDAIEKNPTQKSVFDKKLEPYEIEDYPEFTEELHQLCQSITRTNRFETTVGRIEVVDHNCFKAKMEM